MKQNNKGQLIFRNEWKHSMGHMDYMTIRSRLGAIADESLYAGLGGSYRVRSLAFSESGDEKKGDLFPAIGKKEIFRIRYYNESVDYIRLEKKTRIGGKTNKQSSVLTEVECRSILAGDVEWMSDSEESLVTEFYDKMKNGRLVPQIVADYQREAFVYRPCNVRITMDSGLKTGIAPDKFLDLQEMRASDESSYGTYARAGEKEAVLLKVKYDCFLPEMIRVAIRIQEKRPSSFNKYEARHAFGQA